MKPCALCGTMHRRVNPDVAKNITQFRDATAHKNFAIFRSNSVTPKFAVQQPGLATLPRYLGAFAKSQEVPITLVMSTRLSQCIIAAPTGPHFHGGGGAIMKICREIQIWLKSGISHEDPITTHCRCRRHSPKTCSLRAKWYQAIRIVEEVQTLGERATMLRYAHIVYIVSLILRY